MNAFAFLLNIDGQGSPTHELAISLARIVKPLAGWKSSTIKNAIEFAQKVRILRVSDEEVLVSFDVKSSHTSIPKNTEAQ